MARPSPACQADIFKALTPLPGIRALVKSWPRPWPGSSFRLAMPWSCAGLGLLVVAGWLTVSLSPRSRALGLARILLAADLLQSFPVDHSQPVPQLWRQRFGSQADRLWSQASGSWWQLWSRHDDGGAYLVIPNTDLAKEQRPAGILRVDDLLVISPDRLAAEELKQPLRLSHRQLQGLEQRCLERLRQGQAVYWSSQGLAGILGPLTPLMQHWQQGCLSLQLSSDRLGWEGESSAVPALLGSRPVPLSVEQRQSSTTTLPPGTLLTLRGRRLDLLLGSLLGRSLVRDSLATHYGLDQDSLALLSGSPFELSLRALPAGPFRLGLTLEVGVGQQPKAWIRALDQLDAGISRQGLRDTKPPESGPTSTFSTASTRTWKRPDGVVVGGWRWISPGDAGRGRDDQQRTRVLLFLGPPPPPKIGSLASRSGFRETPESLRMLPMQLLMRPKQLAAQKVLPASLPPLIHAAERLEFVSGSQEAGQRSGEISPLWGELRLTP